MTKKVKATYSPATLALLLRTAAAGLDKLTLEIEVPATVFPWLRAMVRLGNHKQAAEMKQDDDTRPDR